MFLLNRAGWTFMEVDRAFELAPSTASKAAGYPHLNGELAIAKALKTSPSQIWPSRFDASGKRLKPQPSQNYKPRRRIRHCQKRRAA
ncbi:MAG: helix-turn-helix domain-containing protein [Alphaproteobacteria bacterium]|nr:helix-turn-helix domain-containing protein [Alphaproteobacteria bacterium]